MPRTSKLRPVLLSVTLSLFLYAGYFVAYAVVPQFYAGQTIDPGCAPALNTCTVASLTIGDYIKNGTPGSVLFANSAGSLGQDNDNFFWDTNHAALGVGTTTPSARVHIDGNDGTAAVIGPLTVISNAGLDKLTVLGSYTGTTSDTWEIKIDSTGTPDTFQYGIIGTGFTSAPIPLTGGNQILQDGIAVNFDATTGYTVGDTWEFTVDPSVGNPIDPLLVSLDGVEKLKVSTKEIRFFNAYTFPTIDGSLNQVLTTDGTGALSWTTVSGGGSGIPAGGTNGQVLTTDGSGNLSWSTVASPLVGYTTISTALGIGAGTSMGGGSGGVYVGNNAGQSTTGFNNTFLGNQSGSLNNTQGFNTYVGASAGYQNIGQENTFVGSSAGGTTTNGDYSVFIGSNASSTNPTVTNAIAIGRNATADSNQFAISNSITSFKMRGVSWTMPSVQGGAGQVLTNNGTGTLSWTTVSGGGGGLIGSTSGIANTPTPGATDETWLGFGAGDGVSPAVAYNSVFLGYTAGKDAFDARSAVFIGYQSGVQAPDGAKSVFIGSQSGYNATAATGSIFLGPQSGFVAADAFGSIFIGERAGAMAVLASNSIFIGRGAGDGDTVDNSTGGSSILIGDSTQTNGFSDSIALGANAENTKINQFMIGSATSPIDEITVVLDNSGTNLCVMDITGWTCPSDERSKINIATMDSSLERVLALNPVLFDWKKQEQNKNRKMIGFIAQEVEKVFPEMVEKRPNGFYGMNYGNLTPVLTKAIQELNLKVEATLLATGASSPGSFSVLLNQSMQEAIASLGELKLRLMTATEGVFEKITTLFISTKRIETEEFCVGANGDVTCVTKSQLDALLQVQQAKSATIEPPPDVELIPEELPVTVVPPGSETTTEK